MLFEKREIAWGCSSAGRASALQAGGRRFDPDQLHQLLVEGEGWRRPGRERMPGLSVLWPGAAFRAGIFVSGKERKLAATGVYSDIHDRDASAARHSRKQKDQAETGL